MQWQRPICLAAVICVLGSIAVWAKVAPPPSSTRLPSRASLRPGIPDRDRVPIAVQRVAFKEALDGAQTPFVYCLSVNGFDADIDALGLSEQTVVVGSNCVAAVSGSFQKGSRRPARLVTIGGFRQRDERHVVLSLSTYRNGLDAGVQALSLEKRDDGSWVVISVRQDRVV